MTNEQEIHLEHLKKTFCARLDAKYRAGVREHGGNLWKAPNLIGMLMDELVDGWAYAQTAADNQSEPASGT
jgi:hypothetical protein